MQKQQTTQGGLSKGLGNVKRMLTGDEDIISVILEDHRPLKELIKVMKDGEKPVSERKQAFMEFAPLLITHAVAEEKSLYEFMKTVADLKEDAFEGDTEHSIADQLCEEIKRGRSDDEIGAKIKVLAEMVEHHIEEEEDEMFPEIKKLVSQDQLVKLTAKYVDFQAEIIAEGQDNAPPEAELDRKPLDS